MRSVVGKLMRSLTLFLILLTVFPAAAAAADIDGIWKASLTMGNGDTLENTFTFRADGEKLTGTVASQRGEAPIRAGKIKKDKISFAVIFNSNGNELRMDYSGKIKGSELKLTMSIGDRSFDMTAKRQ